MSFSKIQMEIIDVIKSDRKAIVELLDGLDEEAIAAIMDMEIPEEVATFSVSSDSSDSSSGEKKTGKVAKRKYEKSGKPRRVSAYMVFCNDYRESQRDENGKLSNVKSITKDAGEKWSSMDADSYTHLPLPTSDLV